MESVKPLISISWNNLIVSTLVVIILCYIAIKFIRNRLKNN